MIDCCSVFMFTSDCVFSYLIFIAFTGDEDVLFNIKIDGDFLQVSDNRGANLTIEIYLDSYEDCQEECNSR